MNAQELMQEEINSAIRELCPLFDVDFTRLQLPEFLFEDDPVLSGMHFYCSGLNEITMHREGISKDTMGSVCGDYLHHQVNPAIYEEILRIRRARCKENLLAGLNPGVKLGSFITHYSGLYYNRNGQFPSTGSERIEEHLKVLQNSGDELAATMAAAAMTSTLPAICAAEKLLAQFPPEAFTRLTRMGLSETFRYINMCTGIDLEERVK